MLVLNVVFFFLLKIFIIIPVGETATAAAKEARVNDGGRSGARKRRGHGQEALVVCRRRETYRRTHVRWRALD